MLSSLIADIANSLAMSFPTVNPNPNTPITPDFRRWVNALFGIGLIISAVFLLFTLLSLAASASRGKSADISGRLVGIAVIVLAASLIATGAAPLFDLAEWVF